MKNLTRLGLFLLPRYRDGTKRRDTPRPPTASCKLRCTVEPVSGGWRASTLPVPPGGPRPKLPRSGTHLLGVVAGEVPLDPWVRNSLVDGYALQGDPWAQRRPGDRLYCAGNGPWGSVSGGPPGPHSLPGTSSRAPRGGGWAGPPHPTRCCAAVTRCRRLR